MKTPLLQMIKAEPGRKEWQDRIIEGVRDLPDREGYVDSQVVPIVEYVLCRDPVAFFCVARTEEAILADVRERLVAMKDEAKERDDARLRREVSQGLRHAELRKALAGLTHASPGA